MLTAKRKKILHKMRKRRKVFILFFSALCLVAVFGLASSFLSLTPSLYLSLFLSHSSISSLSFCISCPCSVRENPGNLLAYPVITSIMLRGVLASKLRAAYAPSFPVASCHLQHSLKRWGVV